VGVALESTEERQPCPAQQQSCIATRTFSVEPPFVGTRVPFRNLIDYLERNHSLEEFLDSFPTVTREQAVASVRRPTRP
jgi:hypothetical protein